MHRSTIFLGFSLGFFINVAFNGWPSEVGAALAIAVGAALLMQWLWGKP